MSEWVVALLVFTAQLAGWACGRFVRRRLPAEHLSSVTRDSVVLLVGMVATLSALVLGLMISSAKTSFDSDRASVVEIAADILVIDRALAHYGDQAKPARDALRGFLERAIESMTLYAEHRIDAEAVISGAHASYGAITGITAGTGADDRGATLAERARFDSKRGA